MNLKNKFQGTMLGLATGDALGTTVEFKSRGSFTPVTDMVGGGFFQLKPGQWTDDTSMCLCLAESLLECQGMNLTDQLDRYVAWWRNGVNSVTGHCFDIGNTVRSALENYLSNGNPIAGSIDPQSAGNGSIMRLAPVPLYYANNSYKAVAYSAESSRTTHGAPEAVDACRILATIIISFLDGYSKDDTLTKEHILKFGGIDGDSLSPGLQAIVHEEFKGLHQDFICGTGYVVKSLEAALWAFWETTTFEEGALLAVNLGDDADTTGAIYGQIAGAYYGEEGIPNQWLEKLTWRSRITQIADQIYNSYESRKNQQTPQPCT